MSSGQPLQEQSLQDDSSIVTSTMFKLSIPGEYSEKYHYSRYGNPTRDHLESILSSMDDAKYAVTYCSNTAAQMAALSILKPDEIVVFSDILNCLKFQNIFPKLRMEVIDFEDMTNIEESFPPEAKMVFIESSTNLFQTPLDIKFIADFIHTKSEAILVVDNTFLTSYLRKPLSLGADIVVYSLNEYIGGHGDVAMEAVVTNDKNCYEKLRYYQVSVGAVPSPIDCYMMNRSLKTFDVRMERIVMNSGEVWEFLERHEKIEKVFKASVDDDRKNSGILSFFLKENLKNIDKFLSILKTIKVSPTSGGTNTSISHPWSMTHADLPEQKRLDLGITKTFMKLSIGLEQAKEIIDNLNEAFNQL
jgi:cystathionine gamma-lyase